MRDDREDIKIAWDKIAHYHTLLAQSGIGWTKLTRKQKFWLLMVETWEGIADTILANEARREKAKFETSL